MKHILMLILILSHTVAFGKVYLDVDFKDFAGTKPTHLKRIMSADFDVKNTFSLPDSQQEFEIIVSEKLPEEVRRNASAKNSALISFKLFESRNGKRTMVSAGKVLTKYGHTATMKKFDRLSGSRPLMMLKVMPTKI